MPSSPEIVLLVFGSVLLLLALIGGNIKIFGAEIQSTIGTRGRVVAAILGTIFIFLGLFRERLLSPTPPSAVASQPTVITVVVTSIPTITPIPTNLPFQPTASNTPEPPATDTPKQVPTNTPEPVPTETQQPPTPKPTPVPPPPTPRQETAADAVLNVGDPWYTGDSVLILKDAKLNAPTSIRLYWQFIHRGGQPIILTFRYDDFSAVDNFGNRLEMSKFYNGSFYCEKHASQVQPGVKFDFEKACSAGGYYLPIIIDFSNRELTEIIVTASNISNITIARWRIPIPH